MENNSAISNRRNAILFGMILCGVCLLGVSAAWACTAQAVLGPPGASGAGSGVSPSSGPAGFAPVKVEGRAFTAGPIQIRWNSVDGPLLATASGPNFSVDVAIPVEASPGVYSVVALQRDSAGNISTLARAPFEVTPGSAQPQTAPGSAAGGASGATAAGANGDRTSMSLDSGEGSSETEGTANRETGSAGTAVRQDSPGSASNTQPSTGDAGPANPGASDAQAPNVLSTGPLRQPGPSTRSALADLWSGFEKDRAAPSLPIATPRDSVPNAMVAGTALLAVALLSLLAGLALAESRRRREVQATP